MIITIKKKFGSPIIVDTDNIKKFTKSGNGYDIRIGSDIYYFSTEETAYILDCMFN